MARDATLAIRIIADAKDAQGKLDATAGSVGKFQSGMSKLVAPALAVGTALIGIGAAAAKSASRTQQAMGGLDAVFGKQSQVVKDWANGAATAVGLSAAEYAEFAAQTGAQLKNMGIPMDQVAGQTDNLIKLGADLAATYGGTTSDAVSALSAALRGEADPAERYGLALNQTAVNAQMAADGTAKLTGAAKTQAKAQTILAMATEQSGGAIGQFGRESDSAAGSAQIAAAQFENAKSALGTALLPILAAVASKFAEMAGFVSDNARAFQILAVVVGALVVAILAINVALSVYTTIIEIIPTLQKAWAAAQWALNVAMSANPIGIIIIAIIALVAIIVIAYQKSETFRAIVQAVWAAIKTGAAAAVAAFQRIVAAVVAVATAIWTWIKGAWDKVVAVVQIAITALVLMIKSIVAVVAWVANAILAPWRIAFALMSAIAQLVWAVVKLGFRVLVAFIQAGVAIIKAVWQRIAAPIIAVANRIKAAWTAAFNALRSAASVVAAWVRQKFASLVAPIIAVANRIKAGFTAMFNGLKSAASAVSSAIRSAFQRVAGPISSIAARIKSVMVSAFNAIKSAAGRIGGAISAPFRALAGVISGIIGRIQSLIGWLNRIKVPKISIPKGLGASSASTRSVAAPMMAAAPMSLAMAPMAAVGAPTGLHTSTTAGGAAVQITVNGALDPEAVARQIERVLSAAGRRRNGLNLNRRAAGTAAAT